MTQTPPDPPAEPVDDSSDAPPRHGWRGKLPRVVSGQRLKWMIGVVVTAVVGAIATAVITPDLFRGGGGSAGPTSTSTATGPISYKRVARSDGAIAYEVPSTWGAEPSGYDDPPGHRLGPGLTAGVDPSAPSSSYRLGRAFVGASGEKAKTLAPSIAGKGIDRALHDLIAAVDWTIDGCAFDSERVVHRPDGVTGVVREWRDCSQQTDVLYDGYFAPADGSYIASVQVSFPDYSSRAITDHIIDTFRVLPEALVVSNETGESVIP